MPGQLALPSTTFQQAAVAQGGFFLLRAYRRTGSLEPVGSPRFCLSDRELVHCVNIIARRGLVPEAEWIDLNYVRDPQRPGHWVPGPRPAPHQRGSALHRVLKVIGFLEHGKEPRHGTHTR
jgi:hypothetical protein